MQLFDVCAKREYMKNGEKQTKWYKVGTMKSADSGKKYLRLYLLPQTELYIFDKELSTPPENLPVIN